MIEKLQGPGVWVELDVDQIFPVDPGHGTPILVCLPSGDTATWNCAISEGETVDGVPFSKEALQWLQSIEDKVNAWLAKQEGFHSAASLYCDGGLTDFYSDGV